MRRMQVFFPVLLLMQAAMLHPVFAQAQESVAVTFFANEGFLVEGKKGKVLIDGIFSEGWRQFPVPTEQILMQERKALPPLDRLNYILVTHKDGDHINPAFVSEHLSNDPASILITTPQAADGVKSRIDVKIMESRAMSLYPEQGKSSVTTMGSIPFTLLGLPHAGYPSNLTQNLGYIFTLDNMTFFHTGDSAVDLASYKSMNWTDAKIDVMFLPCWFFDPENIDKAREIIGLVKPAAIIIMHVAINKFSFYSDLAKKIEGIPPVYIPETSMQKLNFRKAGSLLVVTSL